MPKEIYTKETYINGTKMISSNITSCPYGFSPYIDNKTNALNPCFLALIYGLQGAIFIFLGVIQFFALIRSKHIPITNRSSLLKFRSISSKHIIHLSTLSLQFVIISCQLALCDNSKITKIAIITNIIFVVFISFPTQYIAYFYSICSMGSQMFYYLFQIIFTCYHLGQKYFHYPDEQFNLTKGEYSTMFELFYLANSLNILIYLSNSFEPSSELREYYECNHLYPTNHIFSNLFFTWMNQFIVETYRNKSIKDPNNLPLPPVDINIVDTTKVLQKNWEQQKWDNSNSLLYAIWNTFWYKMLIAISFETLNDLLTVIQPQFLRYLIMGFNPDETSFPAINGLFMAIFIFLTNILSTLLNNQFYITIFQVGLGIRGSMAALIYQKTLRLTSASKDEFSTGDILNYVAVDVIRLQSFFENAQSIIGAPIQIVVVLFSLYMLLGNAILAGIIPMVIMIPVNSLLSRRVKALSMLKMKYNDSRVKATNEVLSSIKSVKLYSWEEPMIKRLNHIRNDLELENLKKIGITSNLMYLAWGCVPILVTCSTFAVYAIFNDDPLSPELIFPSLSLLVILNGAISSIPQIINSIITTKVSMDRVQKFLSSEDLDTSFIEYTEHLSSTKNNEGNVPVVEIINATFLWKLPHNNEDKTTHADQEASIGTTQVALKNIDYLQATKGKMTCVIGTVGSGKSTLLKAILGELPCISGSQSHIPPKVIIRGDSIAYCPQEAWIMNDSVKNNILFGHKFDEIYYKLTLEACQLYADLKTLPNSDETLVGEKGITLSGGQKARVSLARAIYARADIYLLDDILSAVDAGVRRKIIELVFDQDNGLLKNKTVILTTNAISVLQHSERIYALENGHIVEEGSYKSALCDDGTTPILENLIREFGSNTTNSTTPSIRAKSSIVHLEEDLDEESVQEFIEHEISSRKASLATLKPELFMKKVNPGDKSGQNEEKSQVGHVKMSVYISYAKACGIIGVVVFFIFTLFARLLDLTQTFWLKYWSEKNQAAGKNENVLQFIGVYALIGLSTVSFNTSRTIILLLYSSIRASKKLYGTMSVAVIYSPMEFFNTTPLGRVVNRFSTDMDMVDTSLHHILMAFFQSIMSCFVTIVLVGVSLPFFLVLTSILAIFYIYYQRLFIVQSRELKRLTSTSYSPVVALIGETITGLPVIKAYQHYALFTFKNNDKVQFNINCLFNYRSTNRWLSIRLQTIGAITIFSTALLALLTLRTASPLSAGMVGLLMNYVLQITSSLTWIVRSSVLLENGVISVERILEYADLPKEGTLTVEDYRPDANWPKDGSIEFRDYSTRYREELDPVLKHISFKVKPSEKIGIVGRTGAGKSSLTLALFRLLEPITGTIVIDGMDITKMGLHDLRSHIAIIPQDAHAFEGTVRSNLDPFDRFTNDELFEAIRLAHLEPHLEKMMHSSNDHETYKDGYLNLTIKENGSNLSVGQRQLICLARALLNKSKILILDEATAAVDVETDSIIQETIRSEFKDRTILTIAHRLDTVMDSDKILVMDEGQIKEFDAPARLLSNKDGIFYQLYEKSGYTKKTEEEIL
ncbi:bile pigment transporter 1 [Monosporozyma servazzii]